MRCVTTKKDPNTSCFRTCWKFCWNSSRRKPRLFSPSSNRPVWFPAISEIGVISDLPPNPHFRRVIEHMIDETADGRFALLLYPWLSVPLGVSSHVGRRGCAAGGETPRTAHRGGHCGTGAIGAKPRTAVAGGDSCGTGAIGAKSQRVDVSSELCRNAAFHRGGVSAVCCGTGAREATAAHAGLFADYRVEGETDDGREIVQRAR